MLADAMRLAIGTLTAMPVAAPRTVDPARARLAILLAPVATLPIAVAVALAIVVADLLDLPATVTALLAVGVAVLGSRALHIDGLSDVADGLTASFDAQRSLDVMKSGVSGPAGVVATVLVIGVQAAAIAALIGTTDATLAVAVVVAVSLCVSRAVLVLCCLRPVPTARPDGLGAGFAQSVGLFSAVLVLMISGVVFAAATAWAGLGWTSALIAMLLAGVATMLIIARAIRRFGGVTGDVFGACIEVSWAAMLVGLLCSVG